jgi:hypothetical protein
MPFDTNLFIEPAERKEIREEEMYEAIEPCVDEGIIWLNEQFGSTSWAFEIDLKRLDMGSAAACVAGQLFCDADWHFGFDKVVSMGVDTDALGFTTSEADNFEGEDIAYTILTNIWYDRITDILEGRG